MSKADVSLLLAEMQADFLDELPERCNRLEAQVMLAEQNTPGAFDELYREVHSLKGSGSMFGVPIITNICHQFESFISETGTKFTGKAGTTALAYVDLLRKTTATSGREGSGMAAVEAALEKLRTASLKGRASVLIAEPSEATRNVYAELFSDRAIQLTMLGNGMEALTCMLHQPFDLAILSRELPDLNAVAVVAALRESRSKNADVPVILVSSNPAPLPEHLKIQARVLRNTKLLENLGTQARALLAAARG